MKIEVTGQHRALLGDTVTEKIVTIVISYDPASSEIEVSDKDRGSTYTGVIGFAIEKGKTYELVLICFRKGNRRDIHIAINRVDKIIRDGKEISESEWLSISGGTT